MAGMRSASRKKPRPAAAAAWRVALRTLQSGADRASVVRAMEAAYTSPCSRRAKWSRLRVAYKADPGRSQAVAKTAKALRASPEDAKRCRASQRSARLKKMEKVFKFAAAPLLSHVEAVLSAPEAHGAYELVLALMFATGRRQTEITNGRSRLAAPGRSQAAPSPYALRFQGQLKKRRTTPEEGPQREAEAPEYNVPTLVRPQLVVQGLAALRSKQRGDVASMDNASVSRRYQSGLSAYGRKHAVWKHVGRLHDLRGLYATTCLVAFDFGDAADNYAIMRILGHASPSEVIPYSTYRVTDRKAVPDLGPWVFTDV